MKPMTIAERRNWQKNRKPPGSQANTVGGMDATEFFEGVTRGSKMRMNAYDGLSREERDQDKERG